MDRMILTVFKVLIISTIIMAVVDGAFMAFDTLTVNNRIHTISLAMEQELENNNCIPSDIAPLFDSELKNVVSSSNVATAIEWNIDQSETDQNGNSYPPINQDNAGSYGQNMTIVIKVTMQPHSLMFVKDTASNQGSFLNKSFFQYTKYYVYHVPALRYLK